MNMKTINNTVTTATYQAPRIIEIWLDNEISLAMESDTNPTGEPPGWGANNSSQSFIEDPYKTNMG